MRLSDLLAHSSTGRTAQDAFKVSSEIPVLQQDRNLTINNVEDAALLLTSGKAGCGNEANHTLRFEIIIVQKSPYAHTVKMVSTGY